jgi:hypothetical protein
MKYRCRAPIVNQEWLTVYVFQPIRNFSLIPLDRPPKKRQQKAIFQQNKGDPEVAALIKGLKRICMSCGMRFYDMGKNPIICPSCNTEFTGDIKVKAKRSRAAAVVEDDEEQVEEVVEAVVEEEDDIEEDESDDVSLEDLDEEDDDDMDDEDIALDDDDIDLDDDLDDLDDDFDEDEEEFEDDEDDK